jgi:hypothetical protein
MITKELVAENKDVFTRLLSRYGLNDPILVDFLTNNSDFFIAPASTHESHYNSYPGGLVEHILNVGKYSAKILDVFNELSSNKEILPSKESVIKVSLLHDLGKANLFLQNPSAWHVKNLGANYVYNESLVSMSVGERSVYYLTKNSDIDLSEDEYQAIINHDKPPSDKQSEFFSTPLTNILKIGIKSAILNSKFTNERPK